MDHTEHPELRRLGTDLSVGNIVPLFRALSSATSKSKPLKYVKESDNVPLGHGADQVYGAMVKYYKQKKPRNLEEHLLQYRSFSHEYH
jgi:predicted metal-binding transcription factor (methanogenesis marker protein 9)